MEEADTLVPIAQLPGTPHLGREAVTDIVKGVLGSTADREVQIGCQNQHLEVERALRLER